jgi:hypothetical protein
MWQPFYGGMSELGFLFAGLHKQSPVSFQGLDQPTVAPLRTVPGWSSTVKNYYANSAPDRDTSLGAKLKQSDFFECKDLSQNVNLTSLLNRMGVAVVDLNLSNTQAPLSGSAANLMRFPYLPWTPMADVRDLFAYPFFYPAIEMALSDPRITVFTYNPDTDTMIMSSGPIQGQSDIRYFGLTQTMPLASLCRGSEGTNVPTPYTNACFDYCMKNQGTCDRFMAAQCAASKGGDRCGCLQSAATKPIGGIQFNPRCIDSKCVNAYATASMLKGKEGGCSIVSCTQQTDIKAANIAIAGGIAVEQNCGNAKPAIAPYVPPAVPLVPPPAPPPSLASTAQTSGTLSPVLIMAGVVGVLILLLLLLALV